MRLGPADHDGPRPPHPASFSRRLRRPMAGLDMHGRGARCRADQHCVMRGGARVESRNARQASSRLPIQRRGSHTSRNSPLHHTTASASGPARPARSPTSGPCYSLQSVAEHRARRRSHSACLALLLRHARLALLRALAALAESVTSVPAVPGQADTEPCISALNAAHAPPPRLLRLLRLLRLALHSVPQSSGDWIPRPRPRSRSGMTRRSPNRARGRTVALESRFERQLTAARCRSRGGPWRTPHAARRADARSATRRGGPRGRGTSAACDLDTAAGCPRAL